MPGKPIRRLFTVPAFTTVVMSAVCFSYATVAMAEISTLFTTPQERQIIDANRYRNEAAEQNRRPVVEEPEVVVAGDSDPVMKKVNNTYFISGIAISNEGFHSAWINDQEYMDGDLIEGNIRLKIIAGADVKLRITAPDGKRYYGTSGETLAVTYLVETEN